MNSEMYVRYLRCPGDHILLTLGIAKSTAHGHEEREGTTFDEIPKVSDR